MQKFLFLVTYLNLSILILLLIMCWSSRGNQRWVRAIRLMGLISSIGITAKLGVTALTYGLDDFRPRFNLVDDIVIGLGLASAVYVGTRKEPGNKLDPVESR